MTRKTCNRCNTEYIPYAKKTSWCRACKREYDREYHRNRDHEAKARKVKLQNDRRCAIRQSVVEYLRENPCVDCGNSDIRVLDFDHIDPDSKSLNVSDMMRAGYSADSIFKEINKCRVIVTGKHKGFL